jgi:FdhD protein
MDKAQNGLSAKGIAPDVSCAFYSEGAWESTRVPLPREVSLTIRLNGRELVTILCTPTSLDWLVSGFLYAEGIIRDLAEISRLDVNEKTATADVWLAENASPTMPLRTRTPSGTSFNRQGAKVASEVTVSPEQLLSLMAQLHHQQEMFRHSGGIHCSALADPEKLLVVTEDIGRHNTIDKVLGRCLQEKIPTRDRILLTTGRISSEMLLKASQMETPVIASRGAPTERAASLGEDLDITVVGYVRGSRLSVFSRETRLWRKVAEK